VRFDGVRFVPWTPPAIAREAMANAFRHAAARRIDVEVSFAIDELRVRVHDDGHGVSDEVIEAGRSRSLRTAWHAQTRQTDRRHARSVEPGRRRNRSRRDRAWTVSLSAHI